MTERLPVFVVLCAALLSSWTCVGFGAEPEASIGRRVDNFALQDYRGQQHRLSDLDAEIVVLAFLGTECPLAKLYGPQLREIAQEYAERGVTLWGVNANCQDSPTDIAAYAEAHSLAFPILKDTGNRLADELGAVRTPEVFVLDRSRRLRYRGRIDDQYGVGFVRAQATRHDLKAALDELLSGESVSQPVTTPVGCYIGRVPEPAVDETVTYSDQISRLFQRHCVECHRPGEIAPFSLTDYEEVVGWAETIREVIEDQRMPPWHANPQHGAFANARVMSDEEKEMVYRWVESGAPAGDPSNLPEPRRFVNGWRLPAPPDQVIAMREHPFAVPAEGTVEYQYFVVDPGFSEDKWVSAAEVVPGNRSVVHHAVVFVRPPGGERQPGIGWLAAYVPGQSLMSLPAGQARRVPAGSRFVFQMHYTPNGSPQQDQTKIGMVFAEPASVHEEIVTVLALDRDFEIPPHDADYRVEMAVRDFPRGGQLQALAPHMHLRGKSYRCVAYDGATEQILLDVPRYDFNWQHNYELADPLPLAGLRLQFVLSFDNSANNLVNPDPSATVHWGDQTWEEMALAYLQVAVPRDQTASSSPPEPAHALSPHQQSSTRDIADRLLQRFDQDRDGRIRRDEAAEAFRLFAFGRFDSNGDGVLSHRELWNAAADSVRRRATTRSEARNPKSETNSKSQ